MQIRLEQDTDTEAVTTVISAAFPSTEEADLVNRLREHANPVISVVAVIENELVGHILFSPVTLDTDHALTLMGLAPMAVLPGYQRQGIGTQLVKTGLQYCEQSGAGAVVVLGHADYYPRFGFMPSIQFNIKSEYEVPSEFFMVTELIPDYLANKQGTIQYHPEFGKM
jgi:putative acetyltransferase